MMRSTLRTIRALVALSTLGGVLTLGVIPNSSDARTDPKADKIVERADRIRFPSDGFQVDIQITTATPNKSADVRKYRVISKGNEKTLVMTTAPAVDRGQILLMKQLDLWIFLPTVSQPVRLPLSQRLTGQVANGDLARARFSGDYTATLVRTDKIDGEEYHVLDLKAARRGVTYNRVMYWVNKRDYRPYKAEFFTVSNRMLKRCYYEEFKTLGGAVRPTQLIMEDTLREGERSVMVYSQMKLRKLPDKIFTKQYLKKLQ